jgi:hypothetical protein
MPNINIFESAVELLLHASSQRGGHRFRTKAGAVLVKAETRLVARAIVLSAYHEQMAAASPRNGPPSLETFKWGWILDVFGTLPAWYRVVEKKGRRV